MLHRTGRHRQENIRKNEPDTSFVLTDITIKGTWRSSSSWGDFNTNDYQELAITGADYYNERITIIYIKRGNVSTMGNQVSGE